MRGLPDASEWKNVFAEPHLAAPLPVDTIFKAIAGKCSERPGCVDLVFADPPTTCS